MYGAGAASLYDKNEFAEGEDKLVVAIASDRGLCGGIHSGLGRTLKAVNAEKPIKKTIIVGDKVCHYTYCISIHLLQYSVLCGKGLSLLFDLLHYLGYY